jgi:small subunit ribosomal protein S17
MTKATGTQKTLQGVVVRCASAQTATVRVERMMMHPQFKKYIRRHKTFQIHDPSGGCTVGAKVEIGECRPHSKTKRWEFVKTL